jgi:hypothetical protein
MQRTGCCRFRGWLTACVAGLVATSASAQVVDGQTNPTASEEIVLEHLPLSPPGVLSAVIVGKLDRPGTYVLRNRWPPNTVFGPHTHGEAVRVYTILEGEVWWGFGQTADEAHLVRLGPGSVAYTGPGMEPHYFRTGPDGAVFNVVAEGPFVTIMSPK